MNKLEKEFLDSIDFTLFVKPEELAEYEEKLNAYYEIMVAEDLPDSQVSPARTETIASGR